MPCSSYLIIILKIKPVISRILFISPILVGVICLAERGTMEGILSSKGKTWIEVLDDGDSLHRFIPQWAGAGPANGGGFDLETLEVINRLVVGNRVSILWSYDQHLRVLDVQTLTPKTGEGIFTGYLLKLSNRWIDVQNIEEGIPWRFYLPWVGGYPSEGGGYDRQILRNLKMHEPTNPVRFSWKYLSRPTLVSLDDKINDSITPFWVGKKLPEPRKIRVVGKSQSPGTVDEPAEPQPNPFDRLAPKPVNPFEQVNAESKPNPFEQIKQVPGRNPFEGVQPSPVENTKNKVNPFENVPLPQKSPFELLNNQ